MRPGEIRGIWGTLRIFKLFLCLVQRDMLGSVSGVLHIQYYAVRCAIRTGVMGPSGLRSSTALRGIRSKLARTQSNGREETTLMDSDILSNQQQLIGLAWLRHAFASCQELHWLIGEASGREVCILHTVLCTILYTLGDHRFQHIDYRFGNGK